MHKKQPYSGKQKKKQLQERKLRKKGTHYIKSTYWYAIFQFLQFSAPKIFLLFLSFMGMG